MAWVDVLAVKVPRPDIWRGAGSSHCLSYRQMQRDERPSLHTISRPMKMLRDSLYSIGFEGLDTWFMLAPQATENLSIGRYRANAVLIGGNSEIYDDGIGLSAGQLLNPRGRCGNGGWTDSDVHSLRRVRTQNISGCPCR